jgi:hypothetical protein
LKRRDPDRLAIADNQRVQSNLQKNVLLWHKSQKNCIFQLSDEPHREAICQPLAADVGDQHTAHVGEQPSNYHA